MSPAARKPPLDGLRVLDLGRVVAAPYAAQLLGDLGADVIKIERPKVGDDVRAYQAPDGRKGMSAHFAAWNRNKRSITADLANSEGQAIVRRLAATADVLIQNYVPGTIERFGLDYASLSKLNPRLVYCSVSGYGQTGPHSDRPGMDHVFQARGGLMSVIGVGEGLPGAGPVMTGIVIVDCATGRDAASAILAALIERGRSGLGQHIDISLMDSAVALFSHCAQEYLLGGTPPNCDLGSQVKSGWSGFLQCADGRVFVLGSRNPFFAGLCKVLGVPDMPKDSRFSTTLARSDHRDEIVAVIAPLAAKWKKAELAEALALEGVPAGPVNNAAEVFEDVQVKARGLAVPVDAPYHPGMRLVKSPLGLTETPPTIRRPPPLLGEHTEEVLKAELGLTDAEIARLRAAGAI